MANQNFEAAANTYEILNLVNRSKTYELELSNERAKIYSGESKESIFGFNLSGDDYGNSLSTPFTSGVYFNGKNSTLIEVSSKEYVLGLYEEGDIRLDRLFQIDEEYIGILKYSNSYLMLFRLGDAEMLAAEAYYRIGKEDKALTIINNLKVRSKLSEVDVAGDALWEEIMLEFEREFFGEGKLLFEWNRWGILADKVESITTDQYSNGIVYWPIADECFMLNPGISQNPYWLNN